MYINKKTKEVMCPIDMGYGVFKKVTLKNKKQIFQCDECGLISETLKDLENDVYVQENFINQEQILKVEDYKIENFHNTNKLLEIEEFNNKPFKFKIKQNEEIKTYYTKNEKRGHNEQ